MDRDETMMMDKGEEREIERSKEEDRRHSEERKDEGVNEDFEGEGAGEPEKRVRGRSGRGIHRGGAG